MGIDVLTAFPYALGQVKVVNGFRFRKYGAVQAWALVVAVTFLAPYIYIVVAGEERIPTLVYIVITALAVTFGSASVLRMRNQYRADGYADNKPTVVKSEICCSRFPRG